MAKITKTVTRFSEKDIELIRYVVSNVGIAFAPERIINTTNSYYLVRVSLHMDGGNLSNYARKDLDKKDTPSNRIVYSEEEVWNELLKKYKETYDLQEKLTDQVIPEYQNRNGWVGYLISIIAVCIVIFLYFLT